MAVLVLGYRVGCIHLVFCALGIIGESEVNLAGIRINRTPLRTVHWCGTGNVSGQTGVQQHVGLVLEAIKCHITNGRTLGSINLGGKSRVVEIQGQPFTTAVFVESRYIQRAFIQQVTTSGGCIVRFGRHELVDVLEAGVVTGVTDNRLTFFGRCENYTFMAETTEGCALLGHALRVEWVDFHHKAEGVGFVAVIL